ncbi:RNA polymerase subunit sigma-24 [Pandoraea pneumonica]|uniref:RNA polymerase subunit sigma-24 n=1 Tax=Pandoraea pneumonica TaxID=2508299 RepID=A0A5E4WTR0_9BURK|nr:sigma-70 family RNA polymerase sigma factor [Pandoraea pneumonica]VVE27633.1 RNA polymerase subunit sigma-24 [Pandoraea pneumonica]
MVAHYYTELVNFFAKSLNNRDNAKDLVQEAYAKVLALQTRGTEIRDWRALLYRTGKHLIVSDARRHDAETRMLQTLALIGADHAPSAEHHADIRQQLERLLSRLERMPRKRRDAFILVRIHGMSYAEAASHMQVSLEAIDKHVVRAVMDCMSYRP